MKNAPYTDDEFRAAAKRLHGEPDVSVSPHANVQRVGGGAFVEIILWVPDREASSIRDERAFNQKTGA